MPTRMTRMSRRPRVRRSKYTTKKPSKAFVGKVLKVVRRTQEKKYWPFNNNITVNTAGTLLHLTNISQGDTDVTRDGDMLRVNSIQITFSVNNADAYNILRFVVFQWKPASNGATTPPALGDIFLDTTNAVISPFNHDSRQNYRILMDRRCVTDSVQYPVKIVKMFITRKFYRNIQYSSGTTVASNNIYCWAVSDSGVSAHPAVTYSGKTSFTDS